MRISDWSSDVCSSDLSIVNNMDMRDKIKGLLALGFLKKPSDDWYNELKTTINEIDNDLRPERNRMIHDSRHNTGAEAFRLTTYAEVSQTARETCREKVCQSV